MGGVNEDSSHLGIYSLHTCHSLGLIDPLEGGIALIAAGAIYLVASLIAAKAPPRYLWIPYVIAVVIGVVVLVLATLNLDSGEREGGLWIFVMTLLWLYRVAVLVTFVGSIIYAIRSALRAVKRDKESISG